ncbi:MAG: J domain-containing protein [Chitinophagaceae bacterium]
MHLKDYYKILELEPSATLPEIRKAYRRLALQYHPDKTNNDPYSAALFSEIKEAYEVLTNPAKKEYYLQQRWYDQSIGKRKKQDVITPVTVLKQALELERYVAQLDVFRMDKPGLQEYILDLLSETVIEKLHTFNETDTNRQIISVILHSLKPLPLIYTDAIITQLKKLSGPDTAATDLLNNFTEQHRKRNRREKYALSIIIIVTLILCLLIYFAGR